MVLVRVLGTAMHNAGAGSVLFRRGYYSTTSVVNRPAIIVVFDPRIELSIFKSSQTANTNRKRFDVGDLQRTHICSHIVNHNLAPMEFNFLSPFSIVVLSQYRPNGYYTAELS